MVMGYTSIRRPGVKSIGALLGFALLTIQACSNHNLAPPRIDAYGPQNAKAGVVFNVQPDGSAALWVRTNGTFVHGAVISLDGVKLKTVCKGKVASAAVPPSLYAKPGTYPLVITEEVNGQQLQSNTVDFVVAPN
jgi:hypothetical protein